ncbi:MAG: hypothetical protein IPG89_20150 [Bacteroidetes bacterium]|nr:hypothetical protein [Bacteroidota bacterium]
MGNYGISSDLLIYEWSELHYLKLGNDLGIEAYKILLKNQEDSLVKTISELDFKIKSDPLFDSLNQDDSQSYSNQVYGIEELINSELQLQQRYSLCVALFSFLEGRLNQICLAIEGNSNIKFDKRKKKDGEFDNLSWCMRYLINIYGIKSKKTIVSFESIQKYKQLRNPIVHNEGLISKLKKLEIEAVQGINLISIANNFQIEIKETIFFDNLISHIDDLLNEILIAVHYRYIERKDNSK